MNNDFWPPVESFLDLTNIKQITDSRARCIGVAVCDEKGLPTRVFYQGQSAHFFYEFEITGEIGVPSGGLEFYDSMGRVIHGKNTFQYGAAVPKSVRLGSRLRFHHVINLEVSPGDYSFSVGLASTDEKTYNDYNNGQVIHDDFNCKVYEHCRVMNVGSFIVKLNKECKLLFYGVANLPGNSQVNLISNVNVELPYVKLSHSDVEIPTIFHITHWKAGSQWIYKILRELNPNLIIHPVLGESQFLYWPLQEGKIYPTVYVTKKQFESVRLPSKWRRFVVIRDLRDTLVSAYFSLKVSHPILDSLLARNRTELQLLNFEEGMIYLLDEWLPGCARIQISWLESDEPLIRYEDLLLKDLDILEKILLEDCHLPVSRDRFREIVLKNRFMSLSGRKPGQEDITAHERKGIAGDWKNYFTDKIKRAFKMRYGGLLIETGYEQDLNW